MQQVRNRYGVLVGRAVACKRAEGGRDHYQIHLVNGDSDYRVSINVRSHVKPSELLYLLDDDFHHPITGRLALCHLGFTRTSCRPGGLALDYIRGNLLDVRDMVPLPYLTPGPENDLNDTLDHWVYKAMAEEEALVYVVGERWGPQDKPDKHFRFSPGNGIHDVHMKQGNARRYRKDDGTWQDGAVFFRFPQTSHKDHWVALFLAFQSQSWHTDDRDGHAITPPVPYGEKARRMAVREAMVRIVAAQVNPPGRDKGKETVTLINPFPYPVNLDGWSIADDAKQREVIHGITVASGKTVVIHLSGKSAVLPNDGGTITLLDPNGTKVHGVAYTKAQGKKQGWTLVF